MRAIKKAGEKDLRKAFSITDKQKRQAAINEAVEKIKASLSEDQLEDENLESCIKAVESDIVRGDILSKGSRIDGRDLNTVRPIVCETSLLPRTHGSTLFTRGETQGLVVTTLGTGDDEQIIDALHELTL